MMDLNANWYKHRRNDGLQDGYFITNRNQLLTTYFQLLKFFQFLCQVFKVK